MALDKNNNIISYNLYKNKNDINLKSKCNLIKKAISYLLVASISLGAGNAIGYNKGIKQTRDQIISEMDMNLKNMQNLKEYLTSEVVSLLKTKAQIQDVEGMHEVGTIPLSEIYVLDTQNDGITTYGESALYGYRYIFIRSNQVPTVGGYGSSNHVSGFYGIIFGSDNMYANVTSNSTSDNQGDFYIENSGNKNEALKYIEPLIYYLPYEDVKDFYTVEELETLFYKLNSNSVYRRVISKD